MRINLNWEQRKTIAELLRNEINDIVAGDISYGGPEENGEEIAHLEDIIEAIGEDE
mgnify:CR=1 FL=1